MLFIIGTQKEQNTINLIRNIVREAEYHEHKCYFDEKRGYFNKDEVAIIDPLRVSLEFEFISVT